MYNIEISKSAAKVRFFPHTAKQNAQKRPLCAQFRRFVQSNDFKLRFPCAHARIHKVFYPCYRCRLATLIENQYVTCDNEVTRVTRIGVFDLKIRIKTDKVLLTEP